jgi:hypothetical protein
MLSMYKQLLYLFYFPIFLLHVWVVKNHLKAVQFSSDSFVTDIGSISELPAFVCTVSCVLVVYGTKVSIKLS